MNLGNENETTEFKESLAQLDKGIKSLTAMLNRSGRGNVYFGVDDDGNVKGLELGKNTLMDLRNKIKAFVDPVILPEIEALKDDKGRTYVRVSASGYDIPYSCDGRFYVRNVSADEKATNELLRRMLAAGDSDVIRRMESDEQDLAFSQLHAFLAARGVHSLSSPGFFANYGLLNRDGRFNYMAYLCSDRNECSIKVVRFSGTDKTAMSERSEFGRQCLLASVALVLEHFKSINSVRVDLAGGIRRDTPLFSYEAFREAWINACLHNRWNERIPPSVHVFDDRMEIVSYGGLPYGLSLEGFFHGTSLPVNRALLTLFIAAGLAEQSGHGVPMIVEACGKDAFSFEDGMLKVTIRFAYEPDSVLARKTRERERAGLSGRQLEVLEFLAANPESTLLRASEACGISLAGIKKITARLQELGVLTRTGSKRKGRWEKVDFKSRL